MSSNLSQKLIDLFNTAFSQSEDNLTIKELNELVDRTKLFLHEHSNEDLLNTLGDTSGITPLMAVCPNYFIGDNNRLFELLIESGANVNVADHTGQSTALIYALRVKSRLVNRKLQLERINILLKNGANPNVCDFESSALGIAAMGLSFMPELADIYDTEIVKSLIRSKADVNIRDSFGRTPLMVARGYRTLIELLKYGAFIDARDNEGRTALIKCVIDSNHEDVTVKRNNVLYELLCRGAGIFTRDSFGNTAIEYIDYNNLFMVRQSDLPAPGSNYIRLFLASKYLEHLYLYFRDSDPDKIQKHVDSIPSDSADDDMFPFKVYHVLAMRIFAEIIQSANSQGRAIINSQFLSDFYFLPFFNSPNFIETLVVDVVSRLSPNDFVVDGQTVSGRLSRAKRSGNEAEVNNMEELCRRLRERSRMVVEFYKSFEITADGICAQISRLLLIRPEAEYFTNPNPKLRDYMDKFERADKDLLSNVVFNS